MASSCDAARAVTQPFATSRPACCRRVLVFLETVDAPLSGVMQPRRVEPHRAVVVYVSISDVELRMNRLMTGLLACSGVLAALAFLELRYGGCRYQRWHLSRVAIHSLGMKVETFRVDVGALPGRLEDLASPPSIEGSADFQPYAKQRDLVDAWNRPYFYRASEDGRTFLLFSLGADGRVGGEGEDRDIEYALD